MDPGPSSSSSSSSSPPSRVPAGFRPCWRAGSVDDAARNPQTRWDVDAVAASAAARLTKGTTVRTLLNLIWLIFGGFWLFLGYVAAGLLCCLLIVTIPLGVASFRMASYALWPFGRAVISTPTAGTGSVLANVVWFIVAGWWLALGHLATAFAQAVTIIGIPLAVANLKLLPVSVMPFGKQIVPTDALPVGQRPLHSL